MRPTKPGCCSRLFLSESSSMRSLLFVCLVTSSLMVLCGCKERQGTTIKRDACSLISKEEIESVQAAPVKDTKSSEHSDEVFLVSQCFYTGAEFSKSVSLALVQRNPDQQNNRSPKDFWKKKFGRYANEKEADEKTQRHWVGCRRGVPVPTTRIVFDQSCCLRFRSTM